MLKIQFPVFLDPDSKAATQCGISGLPSTLILDRDGTIKAKILAEAEGDAQRKAYEGLDLSSLVRLPSLFPFSSSNFNLFS